MSAIQQMIDEMQRRGYAGKTITEYSVVFADWLLTLAVARPN